MKKLAEYPLKKPVNRGFTLLELAVVLLISAVIGLALWKLLPAMRGSANADAPRMALRAAQDALDGFVLREHRLPCPAALPAAASASSGIEDCSASLQVGGLPYATLGLAASDVFLNGIAPRYGVYRNTAAVGALDADLAVAKQRFDPLAPVSVRGAINGLDFCVGLQNAIANVNPVATTANGVPIAYGLAHAGMNGAFESSNLGGASTFELPSRAQSNTYDDQVMAAGLSEMFGRLGCPQSLSAANGALRSLYAAFDNDKAAALYEEYRIFVVGVRINNLAFATTMAALATADLLIAVAGSAGAVAVAAATLAIGTFTIPAALAAVVAATASEVAAVLAIASAGIALNKAIDQSAAATANKVNNTEPNLLAALGSARKIIQKGVLQ